MYQMLKFNKCAIPEEGLAMIRYHSCYPWHSKNEYDHFMSEKDHDLKKFKINILKIKQFSRNV